MTIERAKRLAEQWSKGGLCSLRRGEAEEYHKMFLSLLCKKQETNAHLTLDELRQMEGEPVWIKLFDQDEEFWVLRNEWVDTSDPEPMILFHMRWYSRADYGKTWLAYRHKPEDDATK